MSLRVVSFMLLTVAILETASGQVVRTKKPDRNQYVPPSLPEGKELPEQPRGGPLYETGVDSLVPISPNDVELRRPVPRVIEPTSDVQPVNALIPDEPQTSSEPAASGIETSQWLQQEDSSDSHIIGCSCTSCMNEPVCGYETGACDCGLGIGWDTGCDSLGCDGGCGSGCCHINHGVGGTCGNGRLCMNPNEWFGSVELLLMFRDGVTPPPLITTGPSTDEGTAGEIGNAATQILVGNTKVLDQLQAGGRVTIGTWLDLHRCRSLVFRGWYGGEDTFDFHRTSSQTPVLVRPFFNVSDNQTAAQDNNLVAFPGRSQGDVRVSADSSVFGGDISVRQNWVSGYGGSIDLLYGYQYMGLEESLDIATNSIAINVPNTPVGTVQSVTDSFQAENEFHGGQFGLAMKYRERCWSFTGLFKTGFGGIRRTGKLRGQTRTTVGTDVATLTEGFLVQSTNSGTFTDDTFGWVPELDVSFGWHRFRHFDLTLGYHVVAMTDALQVFQTVDRQFAVNSTNPPTGQQRPAFQPQYDTFFVHGIHFGLQKTY